MRLLSLAISNIRSFGLDNKAANKIEFSAERPNILIGPNGSGKSNLLETTNRIFSQYFFRHVTFSWDNFSNASYDFKQVLSFEQGTNLYHFAPNWNSADEDQKVSLSVETDDQDALNLRWIAENRSDLKALAEMFFADKVDLFEFADLRAFDHPIRLDIVLKVNFDKRLNQKYFELESGAGSPQERVVLGYLTHYEVINRLIDLHNLCLIPPGATYGPGLGKHPPQSSAALWQPLKPSFSLIDANRSYSGGSLDFNIATPRELHDSRLQATQRAKNVSAFTIDPSEPAEFYFLKSEIASKAAELIRGRNGEADIPALVNELPILKELNDLLSDALNAKLELASYSVEYRNLRFTLTVNGRSVDLGDLSSGQSALFYLAVRLVTYESNTGLILIDEPENHLHPSLQKKLLSLLEESTGKQSIIATHSPVFVNERSILGVRRFFKTLDTTHVVSGPSDITLTHKDLVSILSYTNASRIFFTDKVLMVEGDTDEYFFRAYLDKKYPGNAIEVLDIGGKNRYKNWKGFMQDWGIKPYFIGDYDNVKEFRLATEGQFVAKDKTNSELKKDISTALHHYQEFKKQDNSENSANLKAAMDSLAEDQKAKIAPDNLIDPTDMQGINKKIIDKYSDGVFIFQSGDLEKYLGISKSKKGIDSVVEFCSEGYNFPDPKLQKELDGMIAIIMEAN